MEKERLAELQEKITKLETDNQKLKLRLFVYNQYIELLKEIYDLTDGAWDDPVISEDLYNRMEVAISKFESL